MTKQDVEKRRADRRAEHDKARDAQEVADLEAIDALENKSGEPLGTMTANRFTPGVPVKVAFRAPTPAEYKRYCALLGTAHKKGDSKGQQAAQEQLAETCMVHPAEGTPARAALYESSPGVWISLAIEAAKVAELRSEDEGKS